MKVWVVMQQYEQDNDGDWNVDIVAVHASPEGAAADPTEPDQWCKHYIVEMELLP